MFNKEARDLEKLCCDNEKLLFGVSLMATATPTTTLKMLMLGYS